MPVSLTTESARGLETNTFSQQCKKVRQNGAPIDFFL